MRIRQKLQHLCILDADYLASSSSCLQLNHFFATNSDHFVCLLNYATCMKKEKIDIHKQKKLFWTRFAITNRDIQKQSKRNGIEVCRN